MFNPFDTSINKGNTYSFGKPGYDRAIAAGYTPEQINEGLLAARQQGMQTRKNSGYEQPAFNVGNQEINKGKIEKFGRSGMERARSAGYSDENIQSALDAAGTIKGRGVPGYRPEFDATKHKFNKGRSSSSFGIGDYNRAAARGYSDEEINESIDRSGSKVGAKAKAALQRPSKKSELFDSIINSM